jgi:hypothetical protein
MRNRYAQHFASVGESDIEEIRKRCEERQETIDGTSVHCPDDAAEQLDAMLHGTPSDKVKQESIAHCDDDGFQSDLFSSLAHTLPKETQLPAILRPYATRLPRPDAW